MLKNIKNTPFFRTQAIFYKDNTLISKVLANIALWSLFKTDTCYAKLKT
jgi:hypothetical protein